MSSIAYWRSRDIAINKEQVLLYLYEFILFSLTGVHPIKECMIKIMVLNQQDKVLFIQHHELTV